MFCGCSNICKNALSPTASRDRWYRISFFFAGLRYVSSDLGDGTTMCCWVPKVQNPFKPNLVLVHGYGPNAMWHYKDVIQHFIPKFNVFVPDLLFFGKSHTSQKDRSETFQAKCLKKLLQLHGVHKASFVGISYGGFVVYSMANQFPDTVEKAVLCCTGVCLQEKDLKEGLYEVHTLQEAAEFIVPQTADELWCLLRISHYKPPKRVPNWLLTDFANIMYKDYVDEKREMLVELLKDRHLYKLPKIPHSTMIIWGEQDEIVPVELGHRLHRFLGSNAQLVVIKEAGHAVNVDQPSEFIKHLKSFLIIESHKWWQACYL